MPEEARKPTRVGGPKLIELVGPFQSGKTTLLESILSRTGALARQGTVRDGSSVGDSSTEARTHAMSVEANIAATDYLGDRYTFIDCPGSIEFISDMRHCLPVCDAAVVVCEADDRKLPALQLILRELEEQKIPHFLFVNKIDKLNEAADQSVQDALAMLQPASRCKLLARQLPTLNDQGIVSGFVDLAGLEMGAFRVPGLQLLDEQRGVLHALAELEDLLPP